MSLSMEGITSSFYDLDEKLYIWNLWDKQYIFEYKNDYWNREINNNTELVSHEININCVSFVVDKWD